MQGSWLRVGRSIKIYEVSTKAGKVTKASSRIYELPRK